ncbi:MAG: GNAT family N-acetyltransferase [Rhodospirillaceae bacterium]|nr:GNAT family N-acetyltransferase [Rhodospirillaceae bacterium]
MDIRIDQLAGTDTAAQALCHTIRRVVFCDEQRVPPALEWDDLDPICTHYLLYVDGVPAATARVRLYKPGVIKIERVAALKQYRRLGIGRRLMERVMADLSQGPATEAVMNAQTQVRSFYEQFGFVASGPEFVEADIPHIFMSMKLR